MDEFQKMAASWKAIIGPELPATDEAIGKYFKYLKDNLQLPCEVTGMEDFPWEERYVFGGGSEKEYRTFKKTQPSYTDKYDLLDIERAGPSPWMILGEDVTAIVRRKKDGKEFALGLADLKATDEESPNFQMMNDYSAWLVNNR